MIKLFKWLNNKVESSAWWLAGYCIVVRIVCEKLFNSATDQAIYTFSIIWWTVFSFIGLKMFLRLFEETLPHYEIIQSAVNAVYIIFAPIAMLYFLAYHPLLGTFICAGWFLIVGICYMTCDIIKKRWKKKDI